jgi:UDP-2,4-diacetamido-2,4,6-trideoxy-beta-L-altropyranose hydrolase
MHFAFRVDSSPIIGIGHFMRCLTLAKGLKNRGFSVSFISRHIDKTCSKALLDEGIALYSLFTPVEMANDTWLGISKERDAQDTIAVLKPLNVDWLIVDHYDIDHVWEERLRKTFDGMSIMVIDDLANRKHECDFLLDQTYGRERDIYQELIPEASQFCGGTHHALIKPIFLTARANKMAMIDHVQNPPHILVSLGGGDMAQPLGIIGEALHHVAQQHDFSLTVIAGNADAASLADFKALEGLGRKVSLLKYSDQIHDEMQRADFAIGAAGGTSWERCCVGLPAIVLTLADNQTVISEILQTEGAGVSVSCDAPSIATNAIKLITDIELRKKMSKNALALCDGKGVKRVINELALVSMQSHEVRLEDAEFIFEARYAEDASRYFRNPDVPDMKDHQSWLAKALEDGNRMLVNISMRGEMMAHLRVDLNHEDQSRGEIGICLAPDWRSRGFGSVVLKFAQRYFSGKGFHILDAEVHTDNPGSRAIFEQTGFQYLFTDSKGFMHYQWEHH